MSVQMEVAFSITAKRVGTGDTPGFLGVGMGILVKMKFTGDGSVGRKKTSASGRVKWVILRLSRVDTI